MNRHDSSTQSELGVALVLAMLLILVLTVLAASIIFVTQSQIWTSINYRLTTQCRYGAEAGVQTTMNWLNYSYTPPSGNLLNCYNTSVYPVITVSAPPSQCTPPNNGQTVILSAYSGKSPNYPDTQQAAFNSALGNVGLPGIANTFYSTYATLLAMGSPGPAWLAQPVAQTWQVTSFGNITGVRNAQVQVIAVYQRLVSPVFPDAIYGTSTACSSPGPPSVAFLGFTDSYNSAQGTYTATVQPSGGNIGTNGSLTLSGSSSIVKGSLSVPPASVDTCSPTLTAAIGATVTGGTVIAAQAPTYPTPTAPNPAPGVTNKSSTGADCGTPVIPNCTPVVPGTITLAPNQQYDNLNISGSTTVNLNAGTYNINSLIMSTGVTLNIQTGPVIINFAGSGITPSNPVFDMTGATLTNSTPLSVPSNLQIVYAGASKINLAGGAQAAAVVYAPNAPIKFISGVQWLGAVVGATVDDTAGVQVDYDRALQNSPQQIGQYRPLSMSWSKF